MTREEWLNDAVQRLRPLFDEVGAPVPEKVRVSCGWPSTKAMAGKSGRRIGECWSPAASADRTNEIFLSPALDDGFAVGAVLVHELVHAAVGLDAGHKAKFSQCAAKLGLVRPWKATTPSPALVEKLKGLLTEPYPHAKLDMSSRKHDTTRMLKFSCVECGWTGRATRKWIDAGLPQCACGGEMEEVM